MTNFNHHKTTEALFTLVNSLSSEKQQEFIIEFTHRYLNQEILMRPDGTVLFPNDVTQEVFNLPDDEDNLLPVNSITNLINSVINEVNI